MKRKIFSALCAFLLTVPAMHAQWVVTDPGNLAQGIVNSVNEMVETSETAQNAMSTFKEASKIYEQSRKYYDMLKSVNSLVSGSLKVKESVLMLSEISESYVTNYGKMLTDENYTQRELEAIAGKLLTAFGQRLAGSGVTFAPAQEAVSLLARQGKDARYGARPLRRFVQHSVETLISRKIIGDQVQSGDTLTVDCRDGELTVESKSVLTGEVVNP